MGASSCQRNHCKPSYINTKPGIIFAFLLILFLALPAWAGPLSPIRDSISRSAPSALSNHTIEFTPDTNIPAGGRIVISFQSGQFTIPAGFAFDDIDFLENAVEQTLAAAADATNQGVSVVTGVNGSITIELDSTNGINAGTPVAIELGSHATNQSVGNQLITNPAAAGSYSISVETQDNLAATIEQDSTLVIMINSIGVSSDDGSGGGGGGGGGSGGGGGVYVFTPPSGIPEDDDEETILEPGEPAGDAIEMKEGGDIADLDINNRVNIIDFSILLANWGIPINPATDLNNDGKVDLTDFSIFLYYWTG